MLLICSVSGRQSIDAVAFGHRIYTSVHTKRMTLFPRRTSRATSRHYRNLHQPRHSNYSFASDTNSLIQITLGSLPSYITHLYNNEIMASTTAAQQSDNIAHAISGAGGGILSMALTYKNHPPEPQRVTNI